MKTLLILLVIAPFASAAELPGLPGYGSAYAPSDKPKTETKTEPAPEPARPAPAPAPAPVASTVPVTAPAPVAEVKQTLLLPPKIPVRPKGTLDTAGEVARDLAVRVQYFEDGQSYYRAYTKGSHNAEENKAFLQFLEEYDNELGIAKRVHSILGVWLEKKSAIKD
ncbi:MAG: hypothetical protein HY923_04445 [Elusimicrobia bacterium]|nr:hypothetical protein [Elusimicrobiota bacterium]